jgi:hypothetical protein
MRRGRRYRIILNDILEKECPHIPKVKLILNDRIMGVIQKARKVVFPTSGFYDTTTQTIYLTEDANFIVALHELKHHIQYIESGMNVKIAFGNSKSPFKYEIEADEFALDMCKKYKPSLLGECLTYIQGHNWGGLK